MNEEKLTEMAIEQQKLISKVWELQSKVTELEARLTAISEIFEQKYDRLGGH
jgi:predicted nuclease with TOPRIM domain